MQTVNLENLYTVRESKRGKEYWTIYIPRAIAKDLDLKEFTFFKIKGRCVTLTFVVEENNTITSAAQKDSFLEDWIFNNYGSYTLFDMRVKVKFQN